jgi:hypothetical protein
MLMNAARQTAMQRIRTEIERNTFENKGEERKGGKSEQHRQQSTKMTTPLFLSFRLKGAIDHTRSSQSCSVMQASWTAALTIGSNRCRGGQFTPWSKG